MCVHTTHVCRLQGRQTSIINNERQEILEGKEMVERFSRGDILL